MLARCESLLRGAIASRPENLLIVSPSNNGKSSLLRQFRDLHPPDENSGGDAAIVPVLLVENPPKPDERRLYDAILSAINVPFKITSTAGEKEALVWHHLSLLRTRVICLDEFHDILVGSPKQQDTVLNVLKKFGNKLGISIIGAGVPEAEKVMHQNDQIDNRFAKYALPLWGRNHEFAQMVAEIVARLPLRRQTKFRDTQFLSRVHARSQGTLGAMNQVLRKAAIYAIDKGTELIDLDAINNSEYQEPSVSAAQKLRRK